MAIAVALLVILVAKAHQCAGVVRPAQLLAQFTDTGGLNKNNTVRITGMDVGNIQGSRSTATTSR